MDLHLIAHNIGFIISAIASLGVFFFLILNKDRSTTSVMFGLTALTIAIWIVSHVIGVNISDPVLSRNVLMFNVVMAGLGIPFNVHAVLSFLNKARSRWYMLAIIYAAGFFLMVWFFWHPDLFLLPSVPKMYFPNYYDPGILNWTRMVFGYGVCVTYMMIELALAYWREIEAERKQQIKYLIVALIIGYAVGNMANFLVYNIQIDPFWSTMFMALFAVPIIYGVIKYELFDIKIIAKQAFLYSIAVAVVGGLITLINYSNNWIGAALPGFPTWITALVSAILAVSVSVIIWRHLREGDILKYEFINTVTHKFRTPLTYIKWASETLSKAQNLDDLHKQVENIQVANTKLVGLTDLLVQASGTEGGYRYYMEKVDISSVVREVVSSLDGSMRKKHLDLRQNVEPNLYADADITRIKFVIQVILENAIHYTKENGTIEISMKRNNADILFSIRDDGIGMTKDELSLIFSKFYRGKEAKLADTEGMGIGLFISKEIIGRHNGKIWAESEGLNKGTTFFVKLKSSK